MAGSWKIEVFDVSEQESKFTQVRALFNSRNYVPAGTYRKLTYRGEIVMSDTPSEYREHMPVIRCATGHVLIAGLGLGVVVKAILRKPQVKCVTIVEKSADVIQLVGKYVQDDSRVNIINSDIFEFNPPRFCRYDVAWYDIWNSLSSDNFKEMTRLKRRFARKINIWQGCWGSDIATNYAK